MEEEDMFDNPITLVCVIAVVLVVALLVAGYLKAPPDKAYIITGLGRKPKILIGKAGIRIPLLQRVDKLSLQMLSVDVKTTKTIPTLDYINIMVDSVAVVKIGNASELINRAAENFLNRDSKYINSMVVNVLEGNLREIIGSMRLVDIMNDRKTFAQKVQDNAAQDMAKMGLEIVSFNIQNIDDNQLGVIDNLGIANTVAIRKTAEISKANAEKEIAVAQAEANRSANDARVASQTAIAEKNTELSIKQSELKQQSDAKKAEADAAYDIQKQEQLKTINTATVNAQIAAAERQAELKQKEVQVRQQELAAAVEKQADADRYAAEQQAEAEKVKRQKKAEADKYEQQQEAEAKKAKAEADKFAAEQEAAGIRAKYEAEAAGIAAKGKAEAEAVRARGLAEAEAMEKKAEAYKKYNGAAMAEMMIKIMPDMAKAIAEPISSIDKINIYGTGNGTDTGASQISGMTPVVMKQVFDTMSEATGVDFSEIMRANTYDAKVTKNINVKGLGGAGAKILAEQDKAAATAEAGTVNENTEKTAGEDVEPSAKK